MSPMKERTMKTTELLATRFSLLQNTLQEQKPRVDSWDGSDDPSLDAIFYIFAFFFCNRHQCSRLNVSLF